MSDQPIALVTGAAQGIGYACAEALAEDGARLVLADINESGVQEAAAKLGNGAAAGWNGPDARELGEADCHTISSAAAALR